MKPYLLTYSMAVLFALVATPLTTAWARRRRFIDVPDVRKIHTLPIPRLGGMAIVLAVMLSALPVLYLLGGADGLGENWGFKIGVLLFGSAIVFALGMCDDIKGLRVRTKLSVEIALAVLVCCAGIRVEAIVIRDMVVLHLGWWSYGLTVLWIVGVMNAVNLIDGSDGLACGLSGIACMVLALLCVRQGDEVLAVIMIAVLGALTGFMPYNFHPARIFMGDCGSLWLGFMVATTSVITATRSHALVGIGLPIVVLGVPIYDTLSSMLRRYLSRRSLFSPDRGHFHHRLLDLGFRQSQVAVIGYGITLLVTGMALIMFITNGIVALAVLACCLVLLLALFWEVGCLQWERVLSGIKQRTTHAHDCQVERRRFEEAQLHFDKIQNFNDWWHCMCQAAKAMDIACMSIAMDVNGKPEKAMSWSAVKYRRASDTKENIQLTVPLHGSRELECYLMEIEIPARESLAMAGQRLALFARLADEYGLATVSDEGDARRLHDWVGGRSLEPESVS